MCNVLLSCYSDDCISILHFRADLQMTFLDLGVLTVLKVSMKVICYSEENTVTVWEGDFEGVLD